MKNFQMTVSPDYLMAQIELLESLGFAENRVWEALEFNKNRLSQKSLRIPVDALLPIFESAERALDDPFIGLRVGFQFRIARFAQTGAIYSYCENLPQVIEMNQRYQRLAIDVAQIKYNIQKEASNIDRHLMQFLTYYDDHERYRHITDLVMGAYGTTYRWLSWGSGGDIKTVYLPYKAPANTDTHKQLFRADLHFEAPLAALEFPAEMMTERLTTYDPEKLTRAVAQLDKVLGTASANHSLEHAVDQAIRGALETGLVSSHIIAKRLDMSPRIFRKEMGEAGSVSYTHLTLPTTPYV